MYSLAFGSKFTMNFIRSEQKKRILVMQLSLSGKKWAHYVISKSNFVLVLKYMKEYMAQ